MKKTSALLLAIVPLLLFAQPSFSEFELYHYLDLGKELYDQGKYDAAIDEFNMLIRRDPQNMEAYQYRGNAYFRTRRYEQAIKDYDLAIELSHRQVRKNDFSRYSQPQVREIDIIEPENSQNQQVGYAMLYNNRGASKYHTGRYEEALEDFEQAERISPELTSVKANADRASRAVRQYADRYNESRYQDDRYGNDRYADSRYKDSRYSESRYQDSRRNEDRYVNNDRRDTRYSDSRNKVDDSIFEIEDRSDRNFSERLTSSRNARESRYEDERRYTNSSRQSDFKYDDPSTYNSSSRVNKYSNSRTPYSRNTSNRNDKYSTSNSSYQSTKIEDLGSRNRTPRYEPKFDSNSPRYTADSKYQRYEGPKANNNGRSSVTNKSADTNNSNTSRKTVTDWWNSRRTAQNKTKKVNEGREKNSNRKRESLLSSKKKSYAFKNVEVKGQTAKYVKISSIVNEEKSTLVHFKLTNYEREPLRLFLERPNDEGAFFITDADTRREYRMIRAFGLNLRPYETIVNVGQSITFSIEFERIDDKTDRIHILEGNYETDTRWNFYDVRLK